MVQEFDVAVVHFVNQFVGQSMIFDKVVAEVFMLPLFRGAVIASIVCWAYFSKYQRIINSSLDWPRIMLGTVLAIAISRLMQNYFPVRLRPRHDPALDFILPANVRIEQLRDWGSFPSDHGVLFGALALAVYFLDRRLGWVAIGWTILVILLPRIYTGAHYPSDVVAGALIGGLIMAGVWLLPSPQSLQRTLLYLEGHHKGVVVAALFLFLYFSSTLFSDVRGLVNLLPEFLDLSG
ncbi:MAG: phosphatase PAP2 family protein [Geminicoccales bacterium]